MAKHKKGKKEKASILRPKGAQRLLKGGGKKLTDDERALLLALAEVEASHLGEEERTALERLKAQVKEYDTKELSRAVEHMISAEAAADRKVEWPELRDKRRRQSAK